MSLTVNSFSVGYDHAHQELCDKELAQRGIVKQSLPEKEAFEAMGRGILRTVVPRTMFH